MNDKTPEPKIDEFAFAEPQATREFLGANKRDSKGKSLFPDLGTEMTVKVISIEPFKKDGKVQPAIIVVDSAKREWIHALNVTNQRKLTLFGIKTAGELVGKEITFASYHTGNTGSFEIGLEIVKVE